MSEVQVWHDERFDPVVEEVHEFIKGMGVQPLPISNIAVSGSAITEEMWSQFPHLPPLSGTEYDGYYLHTNQLVVILPPERGLPLTQKVQLNALLAHGLTHSAVQAKPFAENFFYNEVLAGIGEFAWLQNLRQRGLFKPATDYVLKRVGVEVTIPADRRFLHADEAEGLPIQGIAAKSSTGLLASLALEYCGKGGVSNVDILRSERPEATIRSLLEEYSAGLPERVDGLAKDNSPDSIIRTLSMIQQTIQRRL